MAATLEAGDLGDRDEIAAVLAHHFAAAGDPAQARAYYERAGSHALTRYSNQEAAAHYRAALELDPPPVDQARLLAGLGQALVNQSHFAEGIATGRTAVAAYAALGDGDGLARAYAALAGATFGAGNPPGARAVCAEAEAALAAYLKSPGRAVLLNETARANLFTGQAAAARDTARQAQLLAAQYDDYPTQIAALITLGAAQARTPAAARDTLRTPWPWPRPPSCRRWAGWPTIISACASSNSATSPPPRPISGRPPPLSRLTGFATLEVFAGVLALYCALWLGDLATAVAELPGLRRLAAQIDAPATGVRFLRLAETAILRYQGAGAEAARPPGSDHRPGAGQRRYDLPDCERLGIKRDVARSGGLGPRANGLRGHPAGLRPRPDVRAGLAALPPEPGRRRAGRPGSRPPVVGRSRGPGRPAPLPPDQAEAARASAPWPPPPRLLRRSRPSTWTRRGRPLLNESGLGAAGMSGPGGGPRFIGGTRRDLPLRSTECVPGTLVPGPLLCRYRGVGALLAAPAGVPPCNISARQQARQAAPLPLPMGVRPPTQNRAAHPWTGWAPGGILKRDRG